MRLFAGAGRREFSGLLRHCRSLRRLDWPVHWAVAAELHGGEIWIAANGAGPERGEALVRAAAAAGALEAVVNAGFCGALDPALQVGDIVVADGIESAGVSFDTKLPVHSLKSTVGRVVSVPRVAQTAEEKRRLRASGAVAVEMEAAGMVRVVREYKIPLFCVRSVSDRAGEGFSLDLNGALRPDGRFDTLRLLRQAMARPAARFPELLRLSARSRVASRALGDFIAGCRF